MEKIVGEDEIKGLEEEIDSAVDRLFVEKGEGAAEIALTEPRPTEPPPEAARMVDRETPSHPPAEPVPLLKSFEKMETQLLSLEWEITRENLEKTKEEVQALRESFKERSDITSVLNSMVKILVHMIRNEEGIQPPQIKFLMDSKETIRLLMRRETGGEISIYKQLAFSGIEARSLYLEGIKETTTKPPATGASEIDKTEGLKMSDRQAERMFNRMDLFLEKMADLLKRFEHRLSMLDQGGRMPSKPVPGKRLVPVDVTLFKIDEKLFGIESQKVFKLFKVPSTFQERYSAEQKIRLRDFEIRLVDLKRIFSMKTRDRKGEKQLLVVKEGREYKGLIVDQLVKKLSTEADMDGEYGEYFSGVLHWTYQEHLMEIPILNLKKI
jgi:hypothetical protein